MLIDRPIVRLVARLATAAVLVASLVLALDVPASAGGGGSCPREIPWCTVTGTGAGSGGGHGHGGGGGATTGCYYKGQIVECYLPGLGYYNSADQCYYNRLDPQPAADDPVWKGHDPTLGAFYEISCFDGPPPWGQASFGSAEEWIATPAAGPTPAQLAAEALAKIRLDGASIHMAPTTSATGVGGLVGLQVWMWTTAGAHTWGPIGASASSGALTVRIEAKASKIVWNMGDGHHVTCTEPGQAYVASDGGGASSNCGYTYTKPSFNQASGRYTITATTTWRVTWQGGGDGGVIVTHRTSQASVRINEQQVVVK
jgi:hypothetical protein